MEVNGAGGREAQRRRRRKQQGGSNDGILSQLNCGVKGRDGLVNINKSHIPYLYLRLVRGLWT